MVVKLSLNTNKANVRMGNGSLTGEAGMLIIEMGSAVINIFLRISQCSLRMMTILMKNPSPSRADVIFLKMNMTMMNTRTITMMILETRLAAPNTYTNGGSILLRAAQK